MSPINSSLMKVVIEKFREKLHKQPIHRLPILVEKLAEMWKPVKTSLKHHISSKCHITVANAKKACARSIHACNLSVYVMNLILIL